MLFTPLLIAPENDMAIYLLSKISRGLSKVIISTARKLNITSFTAAKFSLQALCKLIVAPLFDSNSHLQGGLHPFPLLLLFSDSLISSITICLSSGVMAINSSSFGTSFSSAVAGLGRMYCISVV